MHVCIHYLPIQLEFTKLINYNSGTTNISCILGILLLLSKLFIKKLSVQSNIQFIQNFSKCNAQYVLIKWAHKFITRFSSFSFDLLISKQIEKRTSTKVISLNGSTSSLFSRTDFVCIFCNNVVEVVVKVGCS